MERDRETSPPSLVTPPHTASPASRMMSFQDRDPAPGSTPGFGYTPLGRGSTAINTLETDEVMHVSNGCCPPLGMCTETSRIVNRDNGRTNIKHSGLTLKWFGFLTDSFTTLVNSPWYIIVIVFVGSYMLSWLFFGGAWVMVAKYQGNYNGTCLKEVTDFSASLLFSIETQVTIGYGNTYITNDCTSGLIVLILQCMVGLVLDAFLLGLLFMKITRPRNRRKTIMFGDRAVVYEENGDYYLEFRIGNLRKSQIAECHVRMVLYWYRDVGSGCSEFQQHDLQCGYETGTDRVVLLTPVAVRHKIDRNSPLYDVVPSGILLEQLEVVVVLEGIVEATGLTLQALWSYTSEEIVLGEKHRSIVHREGGKWVVDFRRFNEIIVA